MRREALGYARMPLALVAYVRSPQPSDPLRAIVAQREARAERFLDTLARTTFRRPDDPYHRLFRIAGCTLGDLARSVRRDGLESALEQLRRAGVYLTHDEFKGTSPLVRSGVHVATGPSSFDNPLVHGGLVTFSSGSRSAPVRTQQSIASMLHYDAQTAVAWRELRLGERSHAELRSVLPSLRALETCVSASRLGKRIDRWFPVGEPRRDNLHYRLLTRLSVAAVNAAGGDVPRPEFLPPDDFRPVARWIAAERAAGRACAVTGMVSTCVRVAAAALDDGVDLAGTIFSGGGEAITPAKRAIVQSAGAEIYSRYHMTEIGNVGHGCRAMRTGNSVHLYGEAVGVIGHRRPAAFSGAEVCSLLLTTLLPSASRILINVEMDDAGVIDERTGRDCDCEFRRLGLTTVVHDLMSFGKLTGHGVTLVGTAVVEILEQRLPARLGGRVGDFQLVERDAGAQTEIELRVSPRVRASADAVLRCFLDELRRESGGAYAAALWSQLHAMRVAVAEPLTGTTGKVLALHLLGARDAHAARASSAAVG